MPPSEESPKNQPQLSEIVSRLKSANSVLVTVSNNPSVDQLAACIGLTIALNKQEKHATAVFSGAVPSTIDFLEPEKTLEKNTDSLRDFIISLDKKKADKLRYKVEDEVVRIFITPYKTSISEADLDFSQGDFNVDAVVALGVHSRNELDAAIVAHGRILHDASIISINTSAGEELGSMHWLDAKSSSLSEMACDLVQSLDASVLDSQIATAFLTGIVAETDRFRNEKVSPHTMSVAGVLMSAGASTQLVSSKLEEPQSPVSENQDSQAVKPEVKPAENTPAEDGTIQIEHEEDIHIDESGNLARLSEISQEPTSANPNDNNQPGTETSETASLPEPEEPEKSTDGPPSMIFEPPTFGGQLTANTDKVDQRYDHSPDPSLNFPQNQQGHNTLNHIQPPPPPNEPSAPYEPPVNFSPTEPVAATQLPVAPVNSSPMEPADVPTDQTLSDLEKSLQSPHAAQYEETPVPSFPNMTPAGPPVPPAEPDHARDAIERAVQASTDYRPDPSLEDQPLGNEINHDGQNNSDQNTPQGPPPPPVPPPMPPFNP